MSNQPVWTTPQAVFDKLNREFHFEWDLCGSAENAKCAKFLDSRESLQLNWNGRGNCFLNPPYGREIATWLARASMAEGSCIVALIPGRTNAPWWHDFVMRAQQIRFVRKKMAYSDGNGSTGVPSWGSVIVIFEPKKHATIYSSWTQPDHAARAVQGERP